VRMVRVVKEVSMWMRGGCGLGGGGESGREADEGESDLHVGAPPPLT
jgi:hypothetical protein